MNAISHHAALIYVMVVVSASDGNMSEGELRTIGHFVRTLPVFRGFDEHRLLAVSQAMQDCFQPFLGLGAPGAIEGLRNRMQVLPGVMKIERLDGLLEPILSQIPQPHRSVHDQIDHPRPGQSPAQCFLMHQPSKFHR